jgi:type III pantothenate kinase
MKLATLDLGNTNPNVGIFENGKLLKVIPFENYQASRDEIKIVCSVKHQTLNFDYIDLNSYKKNQIFFDMPYDYTETLGIDRLVAGYFSFKNSKQKTAIIDAGTFITMDIVDENGFQGGYIYPGIKTFLQSYHRGENLKQLEFKFTVENGLPHSTDEAILFASQNYLKSILEDFIKRTSPSRILLTGGSMEIINDIFKMLNLKIEIQKDYSLLHYSMQLIHGLHLKHHEGP